MNKCYQCKESLDFTLKLRCLLLSEEQCSSCGAELNFSLFWSVFCILISTIAGAFAAAYLYDNTLGPDGRVGNFLFGVLFGFFFGWFFAAAFLPLIPPPVDSLAQLERGIIAVFAFGIICIIFLMFILPFL